LDWAHLGLAPSAGLIVERVRLPETGIAIEGAFELPELAQLTLDDQVVVASFVKSHGSIKEMERLFGVSYPTIKNRLNRISDLLAPKHSVETPPQSALSQVLDQLERGELSAKEALEALKP
jgi:hypothetical protein